MKSNYWSCSKFANWLRGTAKPESGTLEEWNKWEKSAKSKKIRFWLAEEGLDYLQNLIYWPANRIYDVRCYFNNRWIVKSHALTSNLKRGEWHDLDTRLLHAPFDELVNFVEIEQAWKLVICSDEDRLKYKTPWYLTIFRFGVWRCQAAGIAHLEWAAGLKYDEEWIDKNDPDFGQPTSQALAAQETLALYKWWKEGRPKRPDPSEASGWNNYCEERRKIAKANGDDTLRVSYILNDQDRERSSHIMDIYHKMIKEHDDEDTEMLIRLVKNRQSLWT